MTKHDKEARIIGMANELGCKIDTRKEKKHDKKRDRKILSHKS